MFRRIGNFLKDITETIRRERGKLQINTDRVDFVVKTGSLESHENDVNIQDSKTLQEMFVPMDINNDSPVVLVKGEADYSPSPGVSSISTAFNVPINQLMENKMLEMIKNSPCELSDALAVSNIEVDRYSDNELVKDDLEAFHLEEPSVTNFAEVGSFTVSIQTKDLHQKVNRIRHSDVLSLSHIKGLETEFEKKQSALFHFDNSFILTALIDTSSLDFHIKCTSSLACIMRFPIKRIRVSKSGYERDELKRALGFIVKRYGNSGKLSVVGIYKNVPVDSAERLAFSKDRELYFYMKKGNVKRPFLLDVLVVKTKEGRYHVGPIVREA